MKRSYYTKLVGTTFDDRPRVISMLAKNNNLRLRREPENQYDNRAVAADAFVDGRWQPIGYIAKSANKDLAEHMDDGGSVDIKLKEVTGGGDKNYGVNVSIEYGSAEVDPNTLLSFKKLTPDIGEGTVYFDEKEHLYYDENGNQMVSGSRFEDKYTPEPNFDAIATAVGKSTGVNKDVIKNIWNTQGDIAANFGTVAHSALEFYFNNYETLKQMDEKKEREHSPETYLPFTLGRVVKDFVGRFNVDPEKCSPEIFVRDGNRCGFVDLLIEKNDKTFFMVDYKFIKKMKQINYQSFGTHNKYTLQQNFYRSIIEANGYTVETMDIAHFDGTNWHRIPVEKIDVNKEG